MGLWKRGEKLPVSPGMPPVMPGMAAMLPPRELAKRWGDFLPLIGSAKRPVFLALGGDDGLRRKLWLSTPECTYLRDESSGLAFILYPDSLWVDVPAAFVAPPAALPDAPPVFGGAPGLWEELLRFLPRLPGDVPGILAFVDAGRDPESAARDSLWLAGKLGGLSHGGRGGGAPALWIVSAGLEKFPGGGRLMEKLGVCADALGATSPNRSFEASAFDACLADLEGRLGGCIRSSDATGYDDALSPAVHLVRDGLPGMLLNAKFLHSAVRNILPLGGIFLCGDAGRGLAFGAAIPRTILPDHAHSAARAARGRPGCALYIASLLFLLLGVPGLGALYFRGRAFIDSVPFHLLNPPSVSRYARACAELDRLTASHPLARTLFAAPNRALSDAEKQFSSRLAEWLPTPEDPGRVDALLGELAGWAEAREGVSPLVFSTLSGTRLGRVRGAHSRAGRGLVAGLLAAWRTRLAGRAREKLDFVQSRYDALLYADWRRNGEEILSATLAAAAPGDFVRTRDFLATDAGSAFVLKAGEELDFAGAGASDWARVVVSAARAMMDVSPESENIAAKRFLEYREILAALHPRSLDETALSELAADAYSPPGGNPPPPSLIDAGGAWGALEAALRAEEPLFAAPEGREVADLLRSRESLLSRAAMTHAALRVRGEWDALVRMPLERLDADDAVLFMMDNAPHRAFVKSFAGRFLVVRGGGWQSARALGQEFPFAPDALSWLNRVDAAAAGLDGDYPIRLALLPVTVGRGARAFPRGIHFTQITTDDPVSAVGYNNRVEAAFTWSARTCSDVELVIQFDTFTLRKTYPGRLGFLRFLQSLNRGTLVLPSAAFPEGRREMERRGVNFLHVNFDVRDPGGAARLDADLPPPPSGVVTTP